MTQRQWLTLLTCVVVAHLANQLLASFLKWRRGEMTPEIQWDYGSDAFSSPTRRDCSWAAWHFRMFGFNSPNLFWETVRDMMLHGY